jgi:hypothetical protein
MLNTFGSSLLATLIVSLISLVGVLTIRFKGKAMQRVVLFLVYMSVGAGIYIRHGVPIEE